MPPIEYIERLPAFLDAWPKPGCPKCGSQEKPSYRLQPGDTYCLHASGQWKNHKDNYMHQQCRCGYFVNSRCLDATD